MFVHEIPNRSSPPAVLLRETYREGKKVKSRTVANISHWPPERIQAMRRTLKGDFDGLSGDADTQVDRVFGVLFVLLELAGRLGISKVLGHTRMGRLALFLVLARVARQGSRLSALRWAESQAVPETIGLDTFSEDDLLDSLNWLAENQDAIEKKLYRDYVSKQGSRPALVLYDVTSSYFEGQCNELADYGYNRDGKKGKKQVVIGLLTGPDGEPLAIRVFPGNTGDPDTVGVQIETLKRQFGIEYVVFVGDRGMVKTKGKVALAEAGFKYITALTDPQIRKLIRDSVILPGLFDKTLHEVECEKRRLVLRRNEATRKKEDYRREDKLARLRKRIEERNGFVEQSPRAKPEAGLRQLTSWAKRHKLASFVTLKLEGPGVVMTVDELAKTEAALLDGCYVLETDVAKEKMDAATVDARYRDLSQVEQDFRTLKTVHLEVRPFYLRKAERTRGHAVAAMLALKIAREMRTKLAAAFGTTDDDPQAITLDDALVSLSRWCFQRDRIGTVEFLRLPGLDDRGLGILNALGIRPPKLRGRVVR